jgi:ribosomal 50S subunit-recycling heat shock protein
MRLDKYLKISRLIKRRTVANEACDNGRVTLNGKVARASAEVKPGDVITMAAGCKHTVIADTALQIIEVQLGSEISAADKHKFELE